MTLSHTQPPTDEPVIPRSPETDTEVTLQSAVTTDVQPVNGWNQPTSLQQPSLAGLILQRAAQREYRMWTNNRIQEQQETAFVILMDEVKTHDTPWSVITVNGKSGALARWDTGASHTVISKKAYEILVTAGLAYPLHETKRRPVAANCVQLPVEGIIVLDLNLDSHQVSVAALVVDNLPCPILLGTNLMYQYDKVEFDWEEGKVNLGQKASVPIFGVTANCSKDQHTRILKAESIKPEEEQIMFARVQHPDGTTVLFEPELGRISDSFVAKVVAKVKNGIIPIRMLQNEAYDLHRFASRSYRFQFESDQSE